MEQEPNIEEKGAGKHDNLERKGTSTSAFTLLGTSTDGQSMSGTAIQPNQQSSTREKAARITRRQQQIERRTRTVPTLRLSNNGGIRLDSGKEVALQRKLKIEPIEGSYNSYAVNEKEKRDWNGSVYLACVAAILAIAFFS